MNAELPSARDSQPTLKPNYQEELLQNVLENHPTLTREEAWRAHGLASGNPRYCLKTLQQVATVANSDDNAQDILAIFQGREKPGDTPSLVEKRGNDKTVELIMVAEGIWSLNSNARQHQFVQRAVDDYIAAHPTEPVSKLLQSKAACHFQPC